MPSTKNTDLSSQGGRLRFAFEENGITQAAAAEMVFVSAGQISKWVKGQNALTGMAAIAFEYKLRFRQEWLLYGTGEMRIKGRPTLTSQEEELLDAFNRMGAQSREHLVIYAQGMADAEKPRGK